MEEASLEALRVVRRDRRPSGSERRRVGFARGRPGTVEVAVRHRDRAVHEVAEIIGQVRVVATHEQVPRHVRVPIERDLAQRHVADAIGPERGDEVDRIEEIAAALGHLLALHGHEPVDPHLARRLEPGAPQHRRPEDRVEPRDVLADDVQVGRPPPRECLGVVGEPGARDVVDQRVVPDIDLARLRVPRAVLAQRRLAVLGDRERDAPVARRSLAADREVLESLADEPEHLVAPVVGLDELGMLGELALEPLLVGRQAEEPVALGEPLQRHARVVRADRPLGGLEDVARAAKALVRAVPALVRAEVDVAVRVGPADHLLGRPDVVGIGRPDEPVGADPEGRLGGQEIVDLLVDERARAAAFVERALGDVDRVLVRSREEARRHALHPVPARDRVGGDHLVQRVEAGLVVRVGDGGRQVVTVGHGGGSSDSGASAHPWGARSGIRRRSASAVDHDRSERRRPGIATWLPMRSMAR